MYLDSELLEQSLGYGGCEMTDYYVVIIENKHDNTSRSVLKNFLRKRTKVDMGITQISAEGKTAKEILTTLFK